MDLVCSVTFIAYGTVVGGRFMIYRTASADKQSCKLYSVSDFKNLEVSPKY